MIGPGLEVMMVWREVILLHGTAQEEPRVRLKCAGWAPVGGGYCDYEEISVVLR